MKNKTFQFKKYDKYGWLFVIFSFFMWILWMAYPIINSLIMSFKSGRGKNLQFKGFYNYTRLFKDPLLYESLANTFKFVILAVPLITFVGLIIAVLLNDKKTKFRGFFRTAIFLPCVTSLVACSILFKMMLQTDGIVNQFLMNLHIINEPINWLTNSFYAKITIIIVLVWRWAGYNMVFYLAGMQNISSDYYEAAELDGANKVTQFFKITIPLLKPILVFTTIMTTIGTLQLFDEVLNITKGGPGNSTLTISYYIYKISFEGVSDFGYATAMAYVVLLIILALSFIQFKLAGDKND